jgi:hypothetical protein
MNNTQKTFLFCTALVVLAVVSRIFSLENQWYNFASIGAISLFSGVVFKNKPFAVMLPLAAILASDIVLHFTSGIGFYGISQLFVYVSMIAIALFGRTMKKANAVNIFGYAISSSLIFFILTNFGTWFAGFFPTAAMPAMYPMNMGGLITCFEMGLPFYRNTLVSDLLFSGVLFGVYALFQAFNQNKTLVKAA